MWESNRITASDWISKYFPESRSAKIKRYLKNIGWVLALTFLGVSTAILLDMGKNTTIKRQIDDYTFGVFSIFWRNVLPVDPVVTFTLFGIDRDTIEGWEQNSRHIPRERLRDLVRIAVEGGARAVVLDVALDGDDRGNGQLYDYLKSLQDPAGTPVFLIHNPYLDEPVQKGSAGGCRMVRNTMFGNLDAESPQIHWATTNVSGNSRFLTARYLTQYERICTAMEPRITPSLFLAMNALIGPDGKPPEPSPAAALAELNSKLAEAVGRNPPADSYCSDDPSKTITLGNGRQIVLDQSPCRTENWIRFTLPWILEPGEQAASYRSGNAPVIDRQIVHGGMLRAKPLPKLYQNRIVVIGAVHQDSGDVRITPFGWMPGTMIIINAIHSQINLPDLKPIGKTGVFIIELGISLMASIGAVFLHSLQRRAGIIDVTIIMICCVLVPGVAVYIWGAGLWIDVSAPAIAAFLHHKLLHAVLHRFRGHGGGDGGGHIKDPPPPDMEPIAVPRPDKAKISTTQS
ncbi:CHASE2 domain-containing protein [Azospirillum sp. HJ39]|uniref:CHASE2 domain-containing protein n=1 Tax=Azospirillum sp. HJ39 TaxID=3159496 RepID=UPI0035586337